MTGPRVLVVPADHTACGKNRIIWPAAELVRRGHDVVVSDGGKTHGLWIARWPDGHVASVAPPDADIVVVQRPLQRIMAEALRFIAAHGTRVVIDLDDDLRAVSPNNAAWHAIHPKLSPDVNWHWLERAIKVADKLVVTTTALVRRYADSVSTTMVPNYVPERYLTMCPPKEPGYGWPGNVGVHPDDLRVMGTAIARVDAPFRILGPEAPGYECTGWLEGDDYAKAVATLEVGIAPLAKTTFNRSKSWLKVLEFAALGVPCVASPSDEYSRLAEQYHLHVSFPHTANQWRHKLRALVHDADLRADIARYNRTSVAQFALTIEARADEWWQAWTT